MREYNVIGQYRGCEDCICTLRGDDKSSETVDGINGDGSDEFQFKCGIDVTIAAGTTIGLWKKDGDLLRIIDPDKFCAFLEIVDPLIE